MKIALIGDYDAGLTARQAIPGALDIAACEPAVTIEPVWINSSRVENGQRCAFELDGHRFFIGTACQPEPRSREEKLSPVVAAAVSAAL